MNKLLKIMFIINNTPVMKKSMKFFILTMAMLFSRQRQQCRSYPMSGLDLIFLTHSV